MNRLPLLVLAAALVAPAILSSPAEAQRRGRSSMRAHVQHTTTRTVRRDDRATTTTYRHSSQHRQVRDHRRVVVRPRYSPPAPRYEVRTSPHRRDLVWVAGRWVWHGDHYDWEPGRWVPRRHDPHYQPGRWVFSGNQWVWVQPRWSHAQHHH